MVQYLLSKGVDLTVKTKTGDTILHGGVHSNKPEIVKALIEAGTIFIIIE
jgi:ankyrin repeat protein